MASFPLSPVPSYYTQVTPGQAHGVFYVGGTAPFVTLAKAGATSYSVRDYWGTVVSSGSVTGLTVTPPAPSGGWKPGWYRIYFTGLSTDSVFGPAYGSSCFVVLRNDSRFPGFTSGGTDGSSRNPAAKGAFGMGTSRLSISNANAPTTGSETIATVQAAATVGNNFWTVSSSDPYYDSVRTRYQWTNFPGRTIDYAVFGNLTIYCKDGTVDGSIVTISAGVGTVSGTKLVVNAEVYDNLANPAAAATALLASSLVRGFSSGSSLPTNGTQTIGNAYFNGIKQTVTALYPYGITRFEGPSNEPGMSAETAHQMKLFQAAVHAGNPAALAIGPCPVALNGYLNWDSFLAAGGGNYCDEISFHDYNGITNGELNQGRYQLGLFKDLLAKYGLQNKPLWQTEATQVMTSVYGVYHPRRARVALLMTLLWEQFGVPRERNNYWYDVGHGFWSFPTWWMMEDDTVNPLVVLYRVLAEETFGQTHASALSFGTYGDKIFLGSIYSAPSGASTVVVQATSYMPNSSVTFKVTGSAGTLVSVDGMGNSTTLPVSNGLVTLPVQDMPSYLRLPNGVSVTVDHCNDWPKLTSSGWQNSAYPYQPVVSGTISPANWVVDNNWQLQYTGSSDSAKGTTIPDTVTITWPSATRTDRVLIWSGFSWQSESALVDFDVQTSIDGTTWVTQATVTKSTPTSFQFGADSRGTGCQRETYWDEQYVFDVKLPAPVTCKALRLNVRATSYGGEPDAAATVSGGQGDSNQFITLQEVVVLCDDNAKSSFVIQTH